MEQWEEGVRWTCWSVMLRFYQLWAGTNDGDDSRGVKCSNDPS